MNWWTPNIGENLNYYDKGRYLLMWRVCVLFSFVLSLLAVLNINSDSIVAIIYGIEAFISIFAIWFLHKYKNTRALFWIFTLTASGFVVYSMYAIKHTLHYSDLAWILCIILFAFIGLQYKYALIFVGLHLLVIVHFSFFELNEHLEALRPRSNFELATVAIEMAFAFLVMCALIYQNIKFQTYALGELKKTHVELERQNEENVTLLKEIHHRVKNNLQIVVSLLRMQRAKLPANETREELDNAVKRVMAISLIHNKLYNSNELSTIRFDNYVERLIEEICSFHRDTTDVDYEFETNITQMDMNSMIPLGLIINELVTNSIKHAHEDGRPVHISLKFDNSSDGYVNLIYKDNGEWKEAEDNGLGLELIESLNNQLEGILERNGSSYNIKFKANA